MGLLLGDFDFNFDGKDDCVKEGHVEADTDGEVLYRIVGCIELAKVGVKLIKLLGNRLEASVGFDVGLLLGLELGLSDGTATAHVAQHF